MVGWIPPPYIIHRSNIKQYKKYASEVHFYLGSIRLRLWKGVLLEGEQGYLIIVTQTVITVEWKRRVKEEIMMIKNLPTSSSS